MKIISPRKLLYLPESILPINYTTQRGEHERYRNFKNIR